MSETCRKIKAVLCIVMLAGAEIRQIQQDTGFRTSSNLQSRNTASSSSGTSSAVAGWELKALMSDLDFEGGVQVKRVAEQMDAILDDPTLQESLKFATERMEVIMADPNLHEQAAHVAEQLEAMIRGGPNSYGQAARLSGQIMRMMESPKLQEQAKLLVEHAMEMEAGPALNNLKQLAELMMSTMASQDIQEGSKFFEEQGKGTQAGSSFQEQAKRAADLLKKTLADSNLQELPKVVAEQIETLIADPALQKHVKLVADQMATMLADPDLQEHAKLATEHVESMIARFAKKLEGITTSPTFPQQVEIVAEQMIAAMTDPHLQEQVKLIVEHMSAIMSNPKRVNQAKALANQIDMIVSSPSFHEQVKRAAVQMQGVKESVTSETVDGQTSADKFGKKLSEQVADRLFHQDSEDTVVDNVLDHALKVLPFHQAGITFAKYDRPTIPVRTNLNSRAPFRAYPRGRAPLATVAGDGAFAGDGDTEDSSGVEGTAAASGFFSAFWKFLRPHTIRGTILGSIAVTSRALIENPEVIDWGLLPMAVIGVFTLLCGNGFIVGVNQIYDIEIDKVNKPFLPVAAGELSIRLAWLLCCALAIIGLTTSRLYFGTLIGNLYALGLGLGLAYSAPPLRLKRSAVAAFLIIAFVRGFLLNFGVYYAVRAALRLPFVWSPPTLFITGFVTTFAIAIAVSKDLPDVAGDRLEGVQTFATMLGERRTAFLASGLLLCNYAAAIALAIFQTAAFRAPLMVGAHALLAAGLVRATARLDSAGYSKNAITEFYKFVWMLFYSEYLMFPFI